MKKSLLTATLILASMLTACDKNYDLGKYMVGKWAVVGNSCSMNGDCESSFKYMGSKYYEKNYNSTVLEFRKGGILYQPILGEGTYETEKDSVKLGINLEGSTVWKSSPVNVIGRDLVLIKLGKVWRKYRRIK